MHNRVPQLVLTAIRFLVGVLVVLVVAVSCTGGSSDNTSSDTNQGGSSASDGDAARRDTETTGSIGVTSAAPQKTEIRVGLSELPLTFNPYTSAGANTVTWTVSRTMWPQCMRLTPVVVYEPYFCDGPPTVVQNSPLVVDYRLRADAMWSDGTPVGSDVLAWVHSNCAAEDGDCVQADGYDRSTLEIIDEQTVRLTFEEVFPDYEALFSTPMPPAHLDRDWSSGFGTDPGAVAGPYDLAERVGTSLTLTPNPSWFGRKSMLEKLTIVPVPQSDLAVALSEGEIDLTTTDAEAAVYEVLNKVEGVDTTVTAGLDLEHLTFHADGNRATGDKFTRRALARALDTEEILQLALGDLASEAGAIVPGSRLFRPGQEGYADRTPEEYRTRDAEAGREELRRNGYVEDDQGIMTRNGRPLRLRFVTTAGSTRRSNVARAIANQLADAGVAAEIEELEPDEFRRVMDAKDFDLALFAWVGEPLTAEWAYDRYRICGQLNVGGYYDQVVHRQVSRVRTALAVDSRRAAMIDADNEMWDSIPNVPLYHLQVISSVRTGIEGFEPNPSIEGPLWNVEDLSIG